MGVTGNTGVRSTDIVYLCVCVCVCVCVIASVAICVVPVCVGMCV